MHLLWLLLPSSAAAGLTFTIGGTDLSKNVKTNSVRIEQSTGRRGETCKLTLVDYGNTLSIARFATVRATESVGNVLFAGWVVKNRRAAPSPDHRTYSLVCSNATMFVKARTANKTYTNS